MFPPSTKILIVDDAVTLRTMLKEFLSGLGFPNTFEARNVNEALDTMARMDTEGIPVEVILCDMNMPGASGLDFLKQVRSTPKGKNIPFLMITTEGAMKTVTEAVMAGVTGYLLKPLTQQNLYDKLGDAFKKHKK